MRTTRALWTGCLLAAALAVTVVAGPTPVVISTDIGSDFDDSAALAYALQSPNIDIRMVLTESGDTTMRARIVAKYLTEANRTDIPIGIGVNSTQHAPDSMWGWVDDFPLSDYTGTVFTDGVGGAIQLIQEAAKKDETVTILAIAPCTNFPSLLSRYPDVVHHANVKAMSGSVYRGYRNSTTPSKEHNVVVCPSCSQALYEAAWNVTITPLDTCGTAILRDATYETLLRGESLVARNLVASLLWWARAEKFVDVLQFSDTWYDPVAAYMTASLDHLNIENLPIRVTDDGMTVVDKSVTKLTSVAVTWKDEQAVLQTLASTVAGS